MNLTSDGEKMYKWATKQYDHQIKDRIFSKFDFEAESYFKRREAGEEVVAEHCFENFGELKDVFSKVWMEDETMHEMILIATVAAMRYKPVVLLEEKPVIDKLDEKIQSKQEIPEYVYVF